MRTKIETQQLKCVLTKPELEENARKMATAVIALTEIEADKKESAAAFTDKTVIAKHQANLYSRIECQGYDTRPVDVEISYNYDTNEVVSVRLDNNTEIKRRPMNQAEKQMGIEDAE